MRYRDYSDTDGFKLFDNGQQQSVIGGRVKIDSAGKYSINFNVSSGRYFGWSYADFVGGSYGGILAESTTHYPDFRAEEVADAKATDPAFSDFILNHMASNGWRLGMRQLYLSATPIKQLSFEYGSLGIERGVSTEITTYDNDGYVTGERLRIRDPQHLYFDELTVTYGYMGDFFTPNFFSRGDRLTQSNYHQFMAAKKFGRRLKASVDYTWDKGTNTMREAALASLPEARIFDSVRLELYQRTNAVTFQAFDFDPGNGIAITAGKQLRKDLLIEVGYAYVDHDYTSYTGSQVMDAVNISLNGDAYGTGRRFFTRASIKVNPYISLFGFYTHSFHTFWNSGQEGLTAGFTINFKKLVTDRLN